MAEWLNQASLVELAIACSVYLVVLTVMMVAMGFSTERMYQRRNRQIIKLPLKKNQLRNEAIGNVVFLLLMVPSLTLAIHLGWLRFVTGAAAEVVTFLGCYTAFQLYYYVLHRGMHHRRLFFVHKWHHDSLVTTPLTGLSMSGFEAVGWIVGLVGPAVALAQFDMLGAWGYALFVFFHWSGNINGHANAEFLPDFFGSRHWVSWFANPVVYHSLHHARFDGHYGFGAAFMDRLFKSEFEDWQGVHAKVVSGQALKSLRERG